MESERTEREPGEPGENEACSGLLESSQGSTGVQAMLTCARYIKYIYSAYIQCIWRVVKASFFSPHFVVLQSYSIIDKKKEFISSNVLHDYFIFLFQVFFKFTVNEILMNHMLKCEAQIPTLHCWI